MLFIITLLFYGDFAYMISSLGFDTVIISYQRNNFNFVQIFELLHNLGVKNIILIFDYDPLVDSIAIFKDRFKNLKNYLKSTHSRIKIKCAFNLHLSSGIAFNDSISRLYADKQSKTLFVTLPIFTSTNYEPIALDINHLLYKKSVFTVFTSFEKIVETSSLDFCLKFINNPRIGLCVDINYLLDPQKHNIFKSIIKSNSFVLPSFSNNAANYAGIASSADYTIEHYGKECYYHLCSQINKSSLKLKY